MHDGVSKYWLMSHSGGLDVHGEKTLAKMVEHCTRVHASRATGWRDAVADMRAAVAVVEADCLHDERRDAALELRERVRDDVWAEHGEMWIAEATAPKYRSDDGSDEFSSYRIDHVAAEERYGRLLEEHPLGGLAALYDETIGELRDALDSDLADALWERSEILLRSD